MVLYNLGTSKVRAASGPSVGLVLGGGWPPPGPRFVTNPVCDFRGAVMEGLQFSGLGSRRCFLQMM